MELHLSLSGRLESSLHRIPLELWEELDACANYDQIKADCPALLGKPVAAMAGRSVINFFLLIVSVYIPVFRLGYLSYNQFSQQLEKATYAFLANNLQNNVQRLNELFAEVEQRSVDIYSSEKVQELLKASMDNKLSEVDFIREIDKIRYALAGAYDLTLSNRDGQISKLQYAQTKHAAAKYNLVSAGITIGWTRVLAPRNKFRFRVDCLRFLFYQADPKRSASFREHGRPADSFACQNAAGKNDNVESVFKLQTDRH